MNQERSTGRRERLDLDVMHDSTVCLLHVNHVSFQAGRRAGESRHLNPDHHRARRAVLRQDLRPRRDRRCVPLSRMNIQSLGWIEPGARASPPAIPVAPLRPLSAAARAPLSLAPIDDHQRNLFEPLPQKLVKVALVRLDDDNQSRRFHDAQSPSLRARPQASPAAELTQPLPALRPRGVDHVALGPAMLHEVMLCDAHDRAKPSGSGQRRGRSSNHGVTRRMRSSSDAGDPRPSRLVVAT